MKESWPWNSSQAEQGRVLVREQALIGEVVHGED
jgi:hypothetical protein